MFFARKRRRHKRALADGIDQFESRFMLSGTALVQVVDNGDAGFQLEGTGWESRSGSGYQAQDGDFLYHRSGSGNSVAKWEVNNLPTGWYEVGTTWIAHENRASDATYQVLDGVHFEANVEVNQRLTPSGDHHGTQRWESLGKFYISNGTISVSLSDQANGIVIVDAIQVITLPDIEVTIGEQETAVDWAAETTIEKVITAGQRSVETVQLTNTSEAELHYRATSSNPDLIEIIQGQHWHTLATGETREIIFAMYSLEPISFEAQIQLEFLSETTADFVIPVHAEVQSNIHEDQLNVRLLETGKIVSSEAAVAFPISHQNDLASFTFSFENSGESIINLSEFVEVPWGFEALSVDGEWTAAHTTPLLSSTELLPGESTQLVMRTTASAGTKTGELTLSAINGTPLRTVTLSSTVLNGIVLDEANNDSWLYRSRPYYHSHNQDLTYAYASWGDRPTTWNATDLPDGEYRVWASWFAGNNRATDAAYTISTEVSSRTVDINQRVAPTNSEELGNWQLLDTVTVSNGTIHVELSNIASNGIVIADGIWIEPVQLDEAQIRTVDAGGINYSETGINWFHRQANWYSAVESNFRYSKSTWSSTTAEWTFDDISEGTWEVFASWQHGGNFTSEAVYTIDAGSEQFRSINQQEAPSDLSIDGSAWGYLGTVSAADQAAIQVRLTNSGGEGLYSADAIRIRRVDTQEPVSISAQLVMSDPVFVSDDTVRVDVPETDVASEYEYRFWMQSDSGWELLQDTSKRTFWTGTLPHGTYTIRVEAVNAVDASLQWQSMTELSVRESDQELWDRLVTPYLEEELWSSDFRYDASNFLMVPLVDAFESGNVERQLEFQAHFERLLIHGSDSNGQRGELSWLQYLSLASRFVSEASIAGRESLVNAKLVEFLHTELNQFWLETPAWHWTQPAFAGMKSRLEWKLTVDETNLSNSYENAITDHETFVMNIAADLKTFSNMTGDGTSLAVVNDVMNVTRTMLEQRGTWNDGKWLFQVGYWDDHADYAYAGHSAITSGMSPSPVTNSAPDSAHAHRLPALLKSLIEATPNDPFYSGIQSGLERQFYEEVLIPPSEEFAGYRMTNYLDGTNGLYRYGNWQGGDKGYLPYQLSGRLLYGWWAFLDSDRIQLAYQDLADTFPLNANVFETYSGPVDIRETHPFTALPDAYENGFLELTTRFAARYET